MRIGSGCIIGAGFTVVSNCPDGGVFVGNPSKFKMTTEAFKQRMIELSLELPQGMAERREVLSQIFAD